MPQPAEIAEASLTVLVLAMFVAEIFRAGQSIRDARHSHESPQYFRHALGVAGLAAAAFLVKLTLDASDSLVVLGLMAAVTAACVCFVVRPTQENGPPAHRSSTHVRP